MPQWVAADVQRNKFNHHTPIDALNAKLRREHADAQPPPMADQPRSLAIEDTESSLPIVPASVLPDIHPRSNVQQHVMQDLASIAKVTTSAAVATGTQEASDDVGGGAAPSSTQPPDAPGVDPVRVTLQVREQLGL